MKIINRLQNLSPLAKVILILIVLSALCTIFKCSYCPSWFREDFDGGCGARRQVEQFYAGAPMQKKEHFAGDASSDAHLALFYVDWCPHCKAVKPTFQQLIAKYGENRVKMHNAEDPANVELAKKMKVESYPTIFMIGSKVEGGAVEYNGDRSMESIEEFMKKYM